MDNYGKDFLDLIDEMMSLDPQKRPTATEILEKNIITEKMATYLKDNNYNNEEAEESINNYEKNDE